MRDFNHTIGILVKAYLDGTLVHGDCAACAVGNIIAANINAEIGLPSDKIEHCEGWANAIWQRKGTQIIPVWDEVFCSRGTHQEVNPENYKGWIKKQIDVTGYSWQELAKIEKAFEDAPRNCTRDDIYNDEWMFNGLMAVVEVLADIHGISLEAKETAKQLFVKL